MTLLPPFTNKSTNIMRDLFILRGCLRRVTIVYSRTSRTIVAGCRCTKLVWQKDCNEADFVKLEINSTQWNNRRKPTLNPLKITPAIRNTDLTKLDLDFPIELFGETEIEETTKYKTIN
jgi:hypothetical protein